MTLPGKSKTITVEPAHVPGEPQRSPAPEPRREPTPTEKPAKTPREPEKVPAGR